MREKGGEGDRMKGMRLNVGKERGTKVMMRVQSSWVRRDREERKRERIKGNWREKDSLLSFAGVDQQPPGENSATLWNLRLTATSCAPRSYHQPGQRLISLRIDQGGLQEQRKRQQVAAFHEGQNQILEAQPFFNILFCFLIARTSFPGN